MDTTFSSSELMARPGQTLADHLLNVAAVCASACETVSLPEHFPDPALFQKALYATGFSHDIAKGTSFFQDYIRTEDEKEKARLKAVPETRHGLLSAMFAFKAVSDIVGPEMKAQKDGFFQYLPMLAFWAVKRHHGNPGNLKDEILSVKSEIDVLKRQMGAMDEEKCDAILARCPLICFRIGQFKDAFDDLAEKTLLKDEKKRWRKYRKAPDLSMYLLFQFVYSALLRADKMDAVGLADTAERPEPPSDLVDRYIEKTFGKKTPGHFFNRIRDEIYRSVGAQAQSADPESRIFSINVPTGTGKTFTGFSFALKLREQIRTRGQGPPKIIYCLPFLSVIEQNFSVFETIHREVLGCEPDNATLMKHHHLADISFKRNGLELPSEQSWFFTEGWESQIVVTTFMQLFHTLITNRNRMARKFNAIAGAIVILDEIQTVPYKYWHLIREIFLAHSRLFGTRFVLMTATQPLIFPPEEITELIAPDKKAEYIGKLDRIRFVNRTAETMALEDFSDILSQDIRAFPNKDFLAVLNTINCSIQVYEDIKRFVEENEIKDVELYYLSTNIIPRHRLERIDAIRRKGGRKIAVSTQMVEAGVDIDMDRVYRDFAPLDALNQVAGRCNRNFSEDRKGVVTVFRLANGKPYFRYIYGGSDLCVSKTSDVLEGKRELSESLFLALGMEYFELLKKDASEDDSLYIVEQLAQLNLQTVCEGGGDEDIGAFKLIEAKYPTSDLFIEIDDEAAEVWKTYLEIRDLGDPFERKMAMNRIKRDFYNHVISVPAAKMPGAQEFVTYINREQLESVYDSETGFIRKDPEQFVF